LSLITPGSAGSSKRAGSASSAAKPGVEISNDDDPEFTLIK
jgi:hypothetical protein